MKLQGDSEVARELMQALQSSWSEIVHTYLPEMDKAREKMNYGDLGYGERVSQKKMEIMNILLQMKDGVKGLPEYIRLLENK
jgi:hypothetical protein